MIVYNVLVGSPVSDMPSKFLRITKGFIENTCISRRIKFSNDKKLADKAPKTVNYLDASAEVPYAMKDTIFLQKAEIDVTAKVNNDVHTLNPFFKFTEKEQMPVIMYLTIDTGEFVVLDYKENGVYIHESYGSANYIGALVTCERASKVDPKKQISLKLQLANKRTHEVKEITIKMLDDRIVMNSSDCPTLVSSIHFNDLRTKKIRVSDSCTYTKVYVGTMPEEDAIPIMAKHAADASHEGCIGEYHRIKRGADLKEAIKDITASSGVRGVTIIDSTPKGKDRAFLRFKDCKEAKVNYLFRLDVMGGKPRKPRKWNKKKSAKVVPKVKRVQVLKSN